MGGGTYTNVNNSDLLENRDWLFMAESDRVFIGNFLRTYLPDFIWGKETSGLKLITLNIRPVNKTKFIRS